MDQPPPPAAPGPPGPNPTPPPWPNQPPTTQWPSQPPTAQWPNQATPPGGVPQQPQPPYGGEAAPQYGQTAPQYGQAAPQYGQAPPPYGQAPSPYGQAPSPYGQAPPPSPYGPVGGPTPEATPPAALKPPTKNKFRGLVILGIVAALIFGATWYFNRDKVDSAEVGNCMKLDESDEASPFRIVDCSDPTAAFKVLKVITDSSQQCKDVPGASQSSTSDSGVVCMGDKDADPATAVNVAKEGDCLIINGDDAKRADCSNAAAKDKVLKRLTDVSTITLDNACDEVDGTTAYYSWTWKSVSGGLQTAPDLSVDVLLCLGPK